MKKLLKIAVQAAWLPYLIIVLTGVLTGISVSFNISLSQKLIDTTVQGGNAMYYLALIFGLNILLIVASKTSSYCTLLMDNAVELRCGKEILRDTFDVAYRHFETADTYTVIERVNNEYKTRMIRLLNMFSTAVSLVSAAGSVLIYLFGVQWQLAAALLGLSIPVVLLYLKAANVETSIWRDNYPIMRRFQYLARVLTSREFGKETRLFDSHAYVSDMWNQQIRQWQTNIIRGNMKPRFIVGMFYALQYIVIVGIVYLLLIPYQRTTLSIGLFIAIANAMFSFIMTVPDTIGNILYEWKQFTSFQKDYHRFAELKTQHAYTPLDKSFSLDTIIFSHVWFRYDANAPYVLQDVSLTISKNQITALVGKNGSGKSTLIKLLLGLLEPTEGHVYVNGIDLQSISPAERKTIFAAAFQDFVKYSLTLKENITLSNPDKPYKPSEVLAILDTLHQQSDLVRKLPNGMETVLGKDIDGGVDVSGGNWQTIAIARAIYSQTPCVILDEPTAALDPLAEVEVYDQLFNAAREKTGIFVTHRLGATVRSDRILVLDGGRLAEQGTHDELIRRGELYAQMFHTQKQWYESGT